LLLHFLDHGVDPGVLIPAAVQIVGHRLVELGELLHRRDPHQQRDMAADLSRQAKGRKPPSWADPVVPTEAKPNGSFPPSKIPPGFRTADSAERESL
jgi:hypothetical protein